MEPFVNVAVQLARQAGDYIRRQQDQAAFLEVNYKASGESSLLDVQAENIIIQGIRKKFPKHNILSEEQGMDDKGSDVTWIIDALDGSRNFLHAIPHYAVSIAIQIKHSIEHAVVYDPLRHECFSASRGRGAQLNNRRIRVSQNTASSRALIGQGKIQLHLLSDPIKNFHNASSYIFPSFRKMGCTSLDLAYVACARLDGYYTHGANAWDLAAGMLLIQEAGGLVCDFNGQTQSLPHQEIMAGHLRFIQAWLDEVKKLQN